MGRKINVGAGNFPLPEPWENYDIVVRPPEKPWSGLVHVADARTLDYAGADVVYAGHFIEHLTVEDVRAFFARVRAAGVPELVVTTPVWDRCAHADFETLQHMGGQGSNEAGARHLSYWRVADLMRELRAAGWREIIEWPNCLYLVAQVEWQVCLRACDA